MRPEEKTTKKYKGLLIRGAREKEEDVRALAVGRRKEEDKTKRLD